MDLRLVIFDCDGTLVDSQFGIVQSMQSAFQSFGLIAPEPGAVKRVVGLSLESAVSHLSPDLPPDDVVRVADLYRARFRTLRQTGNLPEPLFEGMVEAIQALDQGGWLLGVATGKSRRGLHAVLERHGLKHMFVTLQTADDVTRGKPAPDMCHRACREAGVDPAAAVVIGDTSFDMAMARSAGAHALGVSWGYHEPAELTEAGAGRVLDHPSELVDAVGRIFGGRGR